MYPMQVPKVMGCGVAVDSLAAQFASEPHDSDPSSEAVGALQGGASAATPASRRLRKVQQMVRELREEREKAANKPQTTEEEEERLWEEAEAHVDSVIAERCGPNYQAWSAALAKGCVLLEPEG